MRHVVVLNAGGYEPIAVTSVKHARKMIHRGVAKAHSWVTEHETELFGIPKAIELVKYIYASWKYDPKRRVLHFSKKGVLKRDGYQCAYVEKGRSGYCENKGVTIDHVVPRALGGQSTWENCVACCFYHNQIKSHKTLEESGLTLVTMPFAPK